MQEDLTVGISEAARLLTISPSSVINWISQGKLEVCYSVGGQRRIPVREIERIKRLSTIDAIERRKAQTQVAREALAMKREQEKVQFSDEDVDSFGDEGRNPALLAAFKGFEVKL